MSLIIIPDRHKKHRLGENKPRAIVIHHTTTPDGRTLSWGIIRLDHMGLVPWSNWLKKPMDEIGYHYGVEVYGYADYEYEEILIGRPETWAGGHCPQEGMNDKSIGVCLTGNFDLAPPSDRMLTRTVREVVVPLMYRYHLAVGDVRGHAYYANDGRTCPGKLFPWDKFYGMIRSEMT
jgi:hypothetical protein